MHNQLFHAKKDQKTYKINIIKINWPKKVNYLFSYLRVDISMLELNFYIEKILSQFVVTNPLMPKKNSIINIDNYANPMSIEMECAQCS